MSPASAASDEHVVGDDRAEAVGDDHLRRRAGEQRLAHRRAHRLGVRPVQVVDDVAGELADDEAEDRVRERDPEGRAPRLDRRPPGDAVGLAVELLDEPLRLGHVLRRRRGAAPGAAPLPFGPVDVSVAVTIAAAATSGGTSGAIVERIAFVRLARFERSGAAAAPPPVGGDQRTPA